MIPALRAMAASMDATPEQITAGLATIRQRRRAAWAALGTAVAVGAVGSAVVAGQAFALVVAAYIALGLRWGALAHRALLTPCPRCGETFSKTWWYRSPWTQYCRHCGLSLRWEPKPGH